MLNAFYHLLIRDLRLALRNRHELANPLIFFVLVVSLFPLAITPTAEALRSMAHMGGSIVGSVVIVGSFIQGRL